MYSKYTICLLVLINLNFQCLASDYCGQPIPKDISTEGYEKPDKPFADPSEYMENSGNNHNSGNNQNQGQNLSGHLIYIPPGSSMPLYLDRPVSSGFSHIGETFYGRVEGMSFGLPSGTMAELNILMVEASSRFFGKPGRLQIGVNRLILPNGQSVWLKGLVIDNKGQNQMAGQTKGKRFINAAGKVALGSGIGAASGAGIAAISKGNIGTGAIAGTIIGVVIGGIWAATQKGQDVMLPIGSNLLISVTEGTQVTF